MAAGELTARAAARFLGVDKKTILALVNDGELKCRVVQFRLRRRIYIPKSEIDRLKKANEQRQIVGRMGRLDQ